MIRAVSLIIIVVSGSQNALFAAQASLEQQCYPEAVYLVRHAEKQQISGERDPELTAQGKVRATSLSKIMRLVDLDKIFSSQFKRTQQTVAPTAKQKSLNIQIRDARASKELAKEILENCNKTVLVSGHSNTVPELLKQLGIIFKVEVQGQSLRYEPVIYLNDKEDYGTLFRVNFSHDGEVELNLSVF